MSTETPSAVRSRKWREANKERCREYALNYEATHREERRQKAKVYHQQNQESCNTKRRAWGKGKGAEKIRALAHRTRAQINARNRQRHATRMQTDPVYRETYCARRADEAKKRRKQETASANVRHHRRKLSDPVYNIRRRLRGRLALAVRQAGTAKAGRTMELTGCTVPELMAHLQSLFLPGMHWNNRELWHIDHKIPCAKFDLTDPAQQRACFHFTNLQPLWKLDNLRKGKT